MKHILLLLSLLGLFSVAQAQTVIQTERNGAVVAIQIGQKLTTQQIESLFGKPIGVRAEQDDECLHGMYRVFTYEGLTFSTLDDVVYGFGLDSDAYTIRIANKYHVKIGMSAAVFRNSIHAGDAKIDVRGLSTLFWFKIPGTAELSDDSLIITADKQGVIREIMWSVPV